MSTTETDFGIESTPRVVSTPGSFSPRRPACPHCRRQRCAALCGGDWRAGGYPNDSSGAITAAASSPNGSLVVTADRNSLRPAVGYERQARPPLQATSRMCAPSHSARTGKLLVTSSQDTTARVWSVPDGTLKTVLAGHRNALVEAAFSLGLEVGLSRRAVTARDGSGTPTRALQHGPRGSPWTADGRFVGLMADGLSLRAKTEARAFGTLGPRPSSTKLDSTKLV